MLSESEYSGLTLSKPELSQIQVELRPELQQSSAIPRHKWTPPMVSLMRALLYFKMDAAGHGKLHRYRDFKCRSSCSPGRAMLWPFNQFYLTSIRYCIIAIGRQKVLIRVLACERARNRGRGQTESGILCWAYCELDLLQPFTLYLLVASGILLLCFIISHYIPVESDFGHNWSKTRLVGGRVRSDSIYDMFRTFTHVLELGCKVTFFSRIAIRFLDSLYHIVDASGGCWTQM